MITKTRHIINLCLVVCTLLTVMSGCIYDIPTLADDDGGKEGKMLVLRIGTIGQTCAAGMDIEQMHSLRVIILDENDMVVHNSYIAFDQDKDDYIHTIRNILPGRKTIYLIANETSVQYIDEQAENSKKSLNILLTAIQTGATGVRETIDGLYFEPDYTQYIPLSARYDIDIALDDTEIDRTLYLVRVATKFSVTFLNFRDDPVRINDFTIASVADRNYLMAHLNEDNLMFKEFPSWIDWLKYVSDESQDAPYNPELAGQRGWVTDYELPAGADKKITYHYNTENNVDKYIFVKKYDAAATPSWGETKVEDIYIPESISLVAGAPTHGDQEYTMTFDIEGGPDQGLSCKLPNLKALFRNTHVLVNVRMNPSQTSGDNFLDVRVRTWEQGDQVDNGYWEEVTD